MDIPNTGRGSKSVTGTATPVTAFIGRTLRGPTDRPRLVRSFAEFFRLYGGLWSDSPLSYSVQHYFLNGGRDALICRVAAGGAAATLTLPVGFTLVAAGVGSWGGRLRVRIEDVAAEPNEAADSRFNLLVKDGGTGNTERFLNLSTDPGHPRYVQRMLAENSDLVRIAGAVPAARPAAHAQATPGADPLEDAPSSTGFDPNGDDGTAINDNDISAPALEETRGGIWMLDEADTVNLVCIPPLSRTTDVGLASWTAAATYAAARRAFLIVDPPANWTTAQDVLESLSALAPRTGNAAMYFPRMLTADPLRDNRLEIFAPGGAVAGIFARIDAKRGVWKAPAGRDAALIGVTGLPVTLTEDENEWLNQQGVNCLRSFPVAGHVIWGSRTLAGADALGSEWKYVPVRRTALFLEESLLRGTQWAVFEPNGEPLWAQVRMAVGEFMQGLFLQGAFKGTSAGSAYFVRCDSETTTRSDIEQGYVNTIVGFAPLRPSEFVVLTIRQRAGQTKG